MKITVDDRSVALVDSIPDGKMNLPEITRSIHHQIISMALYRHSGNRSKAAEYLGLKRTTMVMKMRNLGLINVPQKKQV